jgi:hypothetical protein
MHGCTPHWANQPGWTVAVAKIGLLVWACDFCVQQRRAVRAKTWLQEYCCKSPRFAYFDLEKTCRTCGSHFTFTRTEQARWYEEFKLPPNAEPIECRHCRARKRRRAEANARLAASLHSLDPRNPTQLAELASLYLEVGSSRKAAEFLRRAKNVSSEPKQVAELLERLAQLQSSDSNRDRPPELDSTPRSR